MSPISKKSSKLVRNNYEFAEQFEQAQVLSAVAKMWRQATKKQDWKDGIDTTVPGLAIAHRTRRVSNCGDRRDITIRRYVTSGSKTEFDKLRSGDCKANIYVFWWINDLWSNQLSEEVILDVGMFAKNHLARCRIQGNHDGKTGFAYIAVDDVSDCIISRTKHKVIVGQKREYCPHKDRLDWWLDENVNGRVRVTCSKCKRFIGYRGR